MYNRYLHEEAKRRHEDHQKNRREHFGLTEFGQDAMGMLAVDREDRENKASIARGRFSDLAEQQILLVSMNERAKQAKAMKPLSVHETFRPRRRRSLEMAQE